MSLEKSVVTSNFEWNQEIIENNVSGIMENPMCHADYAKKILWLINHKQKSIEMGVNARRRVFEKFNLDKITEMNISFYKKYINS
jgi:glycosyltransferase involved in cell wall biosynthesis